MMVQSHILSRMTVNVRTLLSEKPYSMRPQLTPHEQVYAMSTAVNNCRRKAIQNPSSSLVLVSNAHLCAVSACSSQGGRGLYVQVVRVSTDLQL
jgi:hypothetical protein